MNNPANQLIETLLGSQTKKFGDVIIKLSTSRQGGVIAGDKHVAIAWVDTDGSPHLGVMPALIWDKLPDYS